MRIGITGATGFIGNAVGRLAAAHGHSLVAFARNPAKAEVPWAAEKRQLVVDAQMPLDAAGLEALVHLAGEPVMGWWTAAKKRRIRDSRVDLTQRITRCVAAAAPRPAVFMCASATGYYGDRADDVVDESSPPGPDFLAQVCVEWEAAARRLEQIGLRVLLLRTGIVLGNEGGAWPLMKMAFHNYLGGRLGSGKQWMPWIHVQDEARMILWAIERSDIGGQINVVSPNPVTNADFTKSAAVVLEKPAFMHAPRFMLKLVLRDLADAFMASQRVMPNMALAHGFQFDHPTLESALRSLMAK